LRMMAAITRANYIVEVGTFTGYSAICMALGMPDGGKLITLEGDEEMRPFHEKYFEKAGVQDKIEVIYGDAMESINRLKENVDMVFIDADKKNYPAYYDKLLPKMKPGGLILADNVLWSGKVLHEAEDKNTQTLQEFNKKVTEDGRVDNFLSYIRDGLMICRVK
jgi:caffeoyl-CoA O-methyltransferase